MRITRTVKRKATSRQVKNKKYRPARRYINEKEQTTYAQFTDTTINDPQVFSYLDYNRNQNMIGVIRKHYEDMIRMYGIDLIYFRKFNTFFKENSENKSNLIYGEDTTAEYYLSGQVRAFLDISTYNWLFNAMGYETQENINIYIGIEDFRTRFATLIGKTTTELFEVPVHGNMQFNELTGEIDIPEFYATIEGTFNNALYAENIIPEMKERAINSQFFKSINHKTNVYPITGSLNGQLYQDECYPLKVSGVLSGELTYHTLENIEDSPIWQIAPQVGDYFNMHIGDIEEEYEIVQIFDRILTNNNGINPLLGKYIFQCSAVRRTPSHEEYKQQKDYTPGNDVLDELYNDAQHVDPQEANIPNYYKEDINCQENKTNNISNKIAKNVFDYTDQSDYTYGGYQDYPEQP